MGPNALRIAAVAVHLLTASGVVWAMLALDAIADDRFHTALTFMLVAFVVDSVDGTLARRIRVSQVIPQISGALLDNIVDYLNYAVVPAWLIHRAGLLPDDYSWAGVAAIVIAAAFQFTHTAAKNADQVFRGFPSYWNIVAFYLLLAGFSAWVNLAIVGGLAWLSLTPTYWVYPSRTPLLRRTTVTLTVLWALLLVAMLIRYPRVNPWVARSSLLYVAYYTALSGWLTYQKTKER
jgi:phosphatidylcholine synthase